MNHRDTNLKTKTKNTILLNKEEQSLQILFIILFAF